MDRIHAQILIAWTENGRGKTNSEAPLFHEFRLLIHLDLDFWEYSRVCELFFCKDFELNISAVGSFSCFRT